MPVEPSFPWRELAETLFRRKHIAIFFGLIGLALGAYTGFTSTPVYKSNATLVFEVQRGRLTGTGMQAERVDRWDVTQQVELLKSRALVREVLVKEGWTDERAPAPPPFTWKTIVYLLPKPRALANRVYSELHDIQGQTPLERYVTQTLRGLSVSPVRGANLIRVGFTSVDAEYAAYFLNNLLKAHVERSLTSSPESQARGFILKQRKDAAVRLEEATTALRKYQQRTGLGIGIVDEGYARSQVASLESDRADAEITLRELKARISAIDREMTSLPRDLTTGSVISANPVQMALQGELASLQVEKTQLLSKYASGSQRMKDHENLILRTEEAIVQQAASTTETTTALNPAFTSLNLQKFDAQVQIEALRARIAGQDARLVQTRGALQQALSTNPELARLKEDVEQASSVYKSYSARAEQARYAGELDETNIFNLSVVEPAEVPWLPIKGKRTQQALISGGLWLLIGCFAAFARDFLDPTVKSASQAARCSGLPVIAEIPA